MGTGVAVWNALGSQRGAYTPAIAPALERKRSLERSARIVKQPDRPRSLQRWPERLKRAVTTDLHAPSVTALPIGNPRARAVA